MLKARSDLISIKSAITVVGESEASMILWQTGGESLIGFCSDHIERTDLNDAGRRNLTALLLVELHDLSVERLGSEIAAATMAGIVW